MLMAADAPAVAALLAKISVERSLTGRLRDVRQWVENRVVAALRDTHTLMGPVSKQRHAQQLLVPTTMKAILPLALGL